MDDATMTQIFGRRGQGKTTRLKALVKKEKRVLMFDPMGEFPQEGFKPVSWSEIPQLLKKKYFKVSYQPKADHEIEALSTLSKYLMSIDPGRMMLGVEEMAGSFPERGISKEHMGFKTLCQRGRHKGISVIGTTQQPGSINPRFKGNCEETYIFSLDWDADVKAVLAMIGPGYRDQLRQLQQHEYLHYANATITPGKNKLKKM